MADMAALELSWRKAEVTRIKGIRERIQNIGKDEVYERMVATQHEIIERANSEIARLGGLRVNADAEIAKLRKKEAAATRIVEAIEDVTCPDMRAALCAKLTVSRQMRKQGFTSAEIRGEL